MKGIQFMEEKNNEKAMTRSDKGKMFLKHCCEHPMDVLRMSKATVLYGLNGGKERAVEIAKNEWERRFKDVEKIEKQVFNIKFSIIIPVYNVDIKWFQKALESIQNQNYDSWEVCIADDASTNPEIRAYLGKLEDERIHVKYLEKNQGISKASNAAAAMATGDYLVLMDDDDELSTDALYVLAKHLSKSNADIVYSDMDMIDEKGNHSMPLYKPDWSPDLMLAQMYLGHLVGFKKELFKQCGGFKSEYDGAQDYDLILRMTEITNHICHIPQILYSWRMLPTSTASNADAKPYAQIAGMRAVQAHMDRVMGEGRAKVDETKNLFVYDVRYALEKKPLVSIIIPTKDHVEDLNTALESVFEETDYENYEVIILDNNSEKQETKKYFEDIQRKRDNVLVVEANYEFNWSKLNNQGVSVAKGEIFIFLNNDVKVIEPTWMQRLVENAVRADIGVAGGLLLYEDDTIQHAGVVAGMGGWADHVYKGMKPEHRGTPFVSPMVTRNVTACTGACIAISRKVIEKIGGFDERFIICGSDVEMCIRALENGYRNVYIPQVKLYHYESKSRDSYIPEIDFKLSDILYSGYRKGGDPYYNKNLDINKCIPEEDSKKKEGAEKRKTVNVAMEAIRELNFRKVHRENYRLNLVVPSLNDKHVFGGIATALRCFEAIGNNLGCEMRIIIIDAELNQKAKEKYGKIYRIVSPEKNSSARYQIVSMVNRKNRKMPVSEKDQFMFTSWWSAYIIQSEYRNWMQSKRLNPMPFLYLIQDYEPGFYAWSSNYLMAESTYRCEYPQYAIFNSHELRDYVLNKGYSFEKVFCFEPVLNSSLKKRVKNLDKTLFKRKQILVYGRPSVDRNAFGLLVESLKRWVKIQENVDSWTILSAGEQHAPVSLGEGIYLESVGKLSIDEYAKVLEESYAGISLMVSPHPSYPPLEMAVFDVKVITNNYSNKNISAFSKNITSVDNVSPVFIAQTLKEICSNYHTVVPHQTVNYEYVNSEEPFGFIKELKLEIEQILNKVNE